MVVEDIASKGRISSKIEHIEEFLMLRDQEGGGPKPIPSAEDFEEPPCLYAFIAAQNILQMEGALEREKKAAELREGNRNRTVNQSRRFADLAGIGSPVSNNQVIPLEGGSLHGDQVTGTRVARAVESQEGGMEDDDTQGEDINYQEEVSSEEEDSSLDGFVAVGDDDSGCESDNSVSYRMRNEDWDPHRPF
tara:strand:- start:524 stop:1099 length:576 start_codon:yes stop_codon:yes gene_type:complete